MDASIFAKNFPDESSCVEVFKKKRLEIGVKCKRCDHNEHYFRRKDLKFQCKKCGSRQSLRSGTVMESSNLPIRYWLMCIELMSSTKKGFSAMEMQRLIGHKRYEPIWLMMHKLRRVMSKRDDTYQLHDSIEIDEGFFERVDDKQVRESKKEAKENQIVNKEPSNTEKRSNKRGRGSERQSKVLVLVESKIVEGIGTKNKPNRKVGFIKMKVMEDLKAETINQEVAKQVDPNARVTSDGYRGYNKLKEVISKHSVVIEPNKSKASKLFPWVNITISNAKKVMLGVYHNCMNDKYVQNYIDEFCYKFNRRFFKDKLADRLIFAAIQNTWY